MPTHGDRHISAHSLARSLGMKHTEPTDPKQAARWTGYLVDDTTSFGMKTALLVYVEGSIWASDTIYIDDGKYGSIIGVEPEALCSLDPQDVNVTVDDWSFIQHKEWGSE